jgi:hypothetical protein
LSLPSRRYLVEDPEREREGVQTLVGVPFILEGLLSPLGLNPYFAWFLLGVNKRRLRASANGDIDLLAGPLEWKDPNQFFSKLEEEKRIKQGWHPTWPPIFAALRLANEGGIRWPPPLNYLVAIEAKCAYLNPQADAISRENLRSTKTSKQKIVHTRAQLRDLLRMGFDQVALLDIIANPPVSGLDGQAWFIAAEVAERSRRAMLPNLENRLPDNSPFGHFVWSSGAVVGGDESRRGAGCPVQLRPAVQNPLLGGAEVKASRREVEENLRIELERIPAPHNLRVILRDCGKCGQLHSDVSSCGA